jgi:hypothetical protein
MNSINLYSDFVYKCTKCVFEQRLCNRPETNLDSPSRYFQLQPHCTELYAIRSLGAFVKLRKATFVVSVRPRGTAQLPTGRIFMKFGI